MDYGKQGRRRGLIVAGFSAVAMAVVGVHAATAQSATGTVTGRVMWGPCVRGIPLPMAADGQPAPQPQSQVTGLPAGAVLVAAQNTSVNARTDDAGRFTLSGVPTGQYLTVAAGPVASASSAVAERPNVFLSGGESVDIGTLSLGGPAFGMPCRMVPGLGAAPGTDASPGVIDSSGATPDPAAP